MFQRFRAFAHVATYLGAVVIAGIWIGAFYLATKEHRRAYEDGIRQGDNLARVFEEYISGVIGGADGMLLTLRDSYERAPRDFKIPSQIHHKQLQNIIRGFAIVGTDGLYKLSSAQDRLSNINVSDREYFRFHANSNADEIHISEPFVGRVSGRSIFQLTRRLRKANGSFGGVILASIDIRQLQQFYSSINIGPEGIVSLVGFDGVIRARSGRDPAAQDFIGKSIPQTKLFALYRQKSAGSYWNFENQTRQFEGVPRLLSYHVVDGYPLIAVVGLGETDIFQQSTLTAHRYYLFALLFTTLVLVAMGIGVTRQKRLIAALSALESSKRSLEQTNLLFDTALENMPHGLCMFDSEGNLTVCNDRYRKLYRLPSDVAKIGCSVVDLLKYRVANRTFDGSAEEYVDQLLVTIAEGKTTKHEVESPDGRIVAVVNQPKPSGGWVALHEDITEQRRAEHERDETKKFLNSIIENIPVAIVVKDAKTLEIVLNNRAFSAMLGLSAAELIGKTAFDLYRAKDAELMDQSDRQAVENGDGVLSNEYEVEPPLLGRRIFSTKRIVIRDAKNDAKYLVVVIDDITEKRFSEQRIVFMAHHDALTGLSNRAAVTEKIQEAAARLRRFDESFTVLLLDLDRFKFVNDSFGHAAGDALLFEVATRLKESLRETDVLARLGGDEFAIIQVSKTDQRASACELADRLIEIISRPFNIEGNDVNVGVSIGIALAPEHATDSDGLMRMADLALYRAKASGRHQHCIFNAEMGAIADQRQELESELRRAIEQDELQLRYQPIVDAKTRKICGAEALVRWEHPTKGIIPPGQFIPVAEETGLITKIGEWVLCNACAEAAKWPVGIKIAVNLSPSHFRKMNLPDVVMYALAQSGLASERLELEITETALIESAAECLPALRQFKNLGIAIALDDFGTGYSSLSQLTMFPFDKIKIDKSFTQNLTKRAECAAIISATLALANSLNIATTAEGVETPEHYRLLRLAGVTSLQGYLFKRPCCASEIDFEGVYGSPEIEDAA